MELIVAGSRSITDPSIVQTAFKKSPFSLAEIDIVIHGNAEGVDSIAKQFFLGNDIPVESMPYMDFIDESPNNSVAPLVRNEKMAEEGDALLAVWNGHSSGTEHMIETARSEDLNVYIYRTDTYTIEDFR